MADEPSDACSRTDGDGVRAGRNNKRKSSRACSYLNKKDGLVLRNARERYVISVFAAVVFMLIYIYLYQDDEEEESDEEDGEEEGEVEGGDGEEEEEEEEDEGEGEEEEEDDDEAHAELLEVTADCFIAAKAWAERELGPGNANIEQILGLLRFLPGYEEAFQPYPLDLWTEWMLEK
ncbi:hypothetical protein GQ55_3G057700 [Panicum hallii var. hallii]|uniref:Uncharacterized protein n=1 Tax=Panicum hallii var. hallii TaxID=1504633 RepID=A0A2T7E670_9POAL|nr:hypothetical protein GQ55_3G057700 [Panicum hallii var. hallii]